MTKFKHRLVTGAITAIAVTGPICINGFAASCEVRLKSPVPVCPAVVYSASECEELAPGARTGRAGDRVYPTILHVMSSGAVFAGAPHTSAIELRFLTFKGCKFKFLDRQKDESPEYVSHFLIE